MENTVPYFKTYYLIQELIMKISDEYQPPESTEEYSPLNILTAEVADKIDKYYEGR